MASLLHLRRLKSQHHGKSSSLFHHHAFSVSCTPPPPLSLTLPLAEETFSLVALLCFYYLWFSLTSLRFHPIFCFASLSTCYGRQHLSSAPTRATLRLSSPARTLDLVCPSYTSSTWSRPVALLQLPSAPPAGILLPGGSARPLRLPWPPPQLRSVMVLHCLLDRCQRLGLE